MEKLNQNMPKTYFGRTPRDLMYGAGFVRARPFYQVPSSPGSTTSTESEFAYPCFILDTSGDDMLLVKFEHRYVGQREQAFHPHEIHLGSCTCRACIGDFVSLRS